MEIDKLKYQIQADSPYNDGWTKDFYQKEINNMKSFYELSLYVLKWAEERGIFNNGEPLAQLAKTQEELDETIQAVKDGDHLEIADGIGDMLVTIIIAAKMLDLDPTTCLDQAYNEIKNRTGKMVDGQFVKDE
tara:strand:- start:1010 stop:1408 length:399 start_codon:yes stop_codon:yes gene_type:complete